MSRTTKLASALIGCLLTFLVQAQTSRSITIPAGELNAALESLVQQTGVQLLYDLKQVEGLRTAGVKDAASPQAAVDALLKGTALITRTDASGAILIANPKTDSAAAAGVDVDLKSVLRLTQGEAAGAQQNAGGASANPGAQETAPQERGTPEILVRGNKLLNMDIQRSRDDAQPYVIFNRETIERSGATNLETFLKQRLPMNTGALSNSQVGTFLAGNTSSINLRGLGANQTLILIDGHRMAGTPVGVTSSVQQTDLNGIPMAAIERIEILPATASGIYGGGATGGVINVILRRDYSGAEVKLRYENTFDTDSALRGIDLAAGFSLEGGRTNVLIAANYSDRNPLLVGDRDLIQRAREKLLYNLGGNYYAMAGSFPMVGATANIRSASGAPLFGPGTSNVTYVPRGYAGGEGLAPLQANAGRFNLDLPETAQSSAGAGQGARMSFGSVPTVEALMTTVRREFSSKVEAFVELAAAKNSSEAWTNVAGLTGYTVNATAPNNPFNQAIQVGVPIPATEDRTTTESYDRRAVGGVLFKLPHRWSGEIDYTWNRSRYSSNQGRGISAAATAAIANGTLDVLRDPSLVDFTPYINTPTVTLPYYSTMKNLALRLSGPIADMPGGAITLSGLAEYRDENIGDAYQVGAVNGNFAPERSQRLSGFYLETKIPLISAKNAIRGVRLLELQVAGRLDDYTLNGANLISGPSATIFSQAAAIVRVTNKQDSINPTLGLRYQPVESLMLRASFGTGFLPPTLNQLVANTPVAQPTVGSLVDPRRGGNFIGGYTSQSGGNAQLRPEESRSWSAGLVFTPSALSGLRLSVDYTRIEKDDNIVSLTSQQVIDNEAFLPGRIVRGANLPGDQPGWAGPITLIDFTATNLSSAWLEAWDIALDYSWDTASLGTFDFYSVATVQPHYVTQVTPLAAEVENAGTGGLLSSIPLKLKGNAGVSWRRNAWSAGWSMSYFDSYLVASPTSSAAATTYQRQGSRYVKEQIYHDVYAGYTVGELNAGALRLFEGVELQLGVKNVLNTRPAYDIANTVTLHSGFGDPRRAVYYFTAKRAF